MEIIKKYYDLQGKLRILKNTNKKVESIIRFKKLKNGKCTNIAYAEVYPIAMKNSKKKGWSYLCRKHYFDEQKRLKWKLPACLKVEW